MTNPTTRTIKRAQVAANRSNITRYIVATANGPRITKASPAAFSNKYIKVAPNGEPVTMTRELGSDVWARS